MQLRISNVKCNRHFPYRPGNFVKSLESGNTRIWYNPELLAEDPGAVFDIDFWQKKEAVSGSATGRGTTWFVDAEKLPVAIRHYFRGGLFGKLVRDSYWYTGWENTRAVKEYRLLDYLIGHGLPVPRPVAARVVRHGLTYRADLISEKIGSARDLVAVLVEQSLPEATYHRIGALVRKLHDCGVNHTDLNIHNILLDEDDKLWLIDFDKCMQQPGEGWKQGNLDRLKRSFLKEVGKRQINWRESDWTELMSGYTNRIQ